MALVRWCCDGCSRNDDLECLAFERDMGARHARGRQHAFHRCFEARSVAWCTATLRLANGRGLRLSALSVRARPAHIDPGGIATRRSQASNEYLSAVSFPGLIRPDTTPGRIVDAVEHAERHPAPIQKSSDRLAGYLVYCATGGAFRDVRGDTRCMLADLRDRRGRGWDGGGARELEAWLPDLAWKARIGRSLAGADSRIRFRSPTRLGV